MRPQAGRKSFPISSFLFLALTVLPSIHASTLFSRQSTQCGGNPNLQQCGADFPSEFCCGSDNTCTRINSTDVESVICCPKGQNCDAIRPLPCDLSLYNATLHPDNQVHIADPKDVKLNKCGADSCCPPGFSCNGNICIASKQKPSSSVSATPSATQPASASQTSDCPAAPTIQSSPAFDGKAFAAGFFPGIVIGALGVIGLLWIIKKRQEKNKQRYSGDFGHVARTISDPIYNPMYGDRTDFIRRPSHSTTSTGPSVQKNIGTRAAGGTSNGGGGGGLTPKIKSMWDRTPKLGIGVWSGLPTTPPPAVRAGERDPYRTPVQQSQTPSPERTPHTRTHSRRRKKSRSKHATATRSTSSETIDVLMPAPSLLPPPTLLEPPRAPGMRENRFTQDSSHTTFTKLMERAGYGNDTRDDVRNLSYGPRR
ncbi:hypothetical protein DM02DRAFT_614508 [Periconia macrospinosa]|uniref:Mid2 domain-containing protein n=1 Tax=Periconia macrospinosa TaxID=97972 RepID=A0A2V1DQI9_9PLEO|nr:hypothetical protein DM02DRAFT_614508 [Periconia macrospinosa]